MSGYPHTVRALRDRLTEAMELDPAVAEYDVILEQAEEGLTTRPWSGKTFRRPDERTFELEVPA
ncbi:hypothetical protein GA0115240_105832 [Streptomyces sp. DvalAA-14]|uniref:hypothetical protein n=1 Tax=unclassified Streptomyces TaxID=2593676 RepID=UPI00081AFCD8|nr:MULTISPECIES: hypothetical protein [unclassified Streptomyces]MYS19179.1 hypothetical protein [Streptomyces sp. SID4948]SCD38411.1 hypothetical protein GA0115240_105832 [Streptomyces sp. DvalAA-14]